MASVEAVICSIWRRGERQEADRSLYFERDQCQGRVQIERIGLQGNMTFHSLTRGGAGGAAKMRDRFERAVLAQTRQTYSELLDALPQAKQSLGDGTVPMFGETFILDGFSTRDICVGDVFKSSRSPLTLQVASPRYGCHRVDKKHPMIERPSGDMGTMRHFVNGTGRGGILFRVLTPGDAGEGDYLQLLRRPFPQWTLEYLSGITFPLAALSCLRPTWNGSDAELQELCEFEELAFWEWKDVYRELREKGVVGMNVDALSGNGTVENVGIRLTGTKQCPDCNQKFDTEKAKELHWKFIHDPNRHQED